jgi:GxxExxY protein
MSPSRLVTTIPYHDLCYRITGAAMAVHNKLGPGHKEAHYHQALLVELLTNGIATEKDKGIEITMNGIGVGLLYLDLLVEQAVVVELKAFSHLLTAEEDAQVLTYLGATGLPVGMLYNFGRRRLQYKRILPAKNSEQWHERIQRYLFHPTEPLAR